MDERRRLVRFPFECNCTYNLSKAGDVYSALVEDITIRGARVTVDLTHEILPGTLLDMRLMLSEEVVDVYGMAVWIKEFKRVKKVGIFFVKIPGRSSNKIFNCIFKSNPQEYLQRWWDM